MEIHIAHSNQAFIQQQISSGTYSSAQEVVAEALRFMEIESSVQAAKLEKLRQDIALGLVGGAKLWEAEEVKLLARKVKFGEVDIYDVY